MASPPETRWLAMQDLAKIYEIGKNASPMEACGLLLPEPHHNRCVVQLPNRTNMVGAFSFTSSDIAMTLEGWAGDWNQLAIWHTHPEGQAYPSQGDLDNKPIPHLGYLIVAIDPSGPKAIWY